MFFSYRHIVCLFVLLGCLLAPSTDAGAAAAAGTDPARSALAAYVREKAAFQEKLTKELLAADFGKGDALDAAGDLERALAYCWLVRGNQARLTEARKILLDTSRVANARVRTLDKGHTDDVLRVLKQAYPNSGPERRQKTSAPDEEFWRRAAERARLEPKVSLLLDRLNAVRKDADEGRQQRPGEVVEIATLLLPFAEDKDVMRSAEAMIKTAPQGDIYALAQTLEQRRESAPASFREYLLLREELQRFNADYRAVASEVVHLPLKAYLPDWDKTLSKLGVNGLSEKSVQVPDDALDLQACRHDNGFTVEVLADGTGTTLAEYFGGDAELFAVENPLPGAFYGARASRATAVSRHPLFRNTPLQSYMDDKERVVRRGRLDALAPELGGSGATAVGFWVVEAAVADKAGEALAEHLSWLGLALADREARQRGNVDVLADLAVASHLLPYAPPADAWGKSALVDKAARQLRLVRAWTLAYVLTVAERADKEQLDALFGPAKAFVVRRSSNGPWYVLTRGPVPPTPFVGQPGKMKPMALPESFLVDLSRRERALMRASLQNQYKCKGLAETAQLEFDALLDKTDIAGLEDRHWLHAMLCEAARRGLHERYMKAAATALADTALPLKQRLENMMRAVMN